MDRKTICHIFDCPNSLGDQILNSLIMAGNTFFGTLVGIGALGIVKDATTALIGAGISAGFTFFSSLAMQRRLKKPEVKKPEE